MRADEAQAIHDRRRAEDPGHDRSGCWCCCLDCDFDFEAVVESALGVARDSGVGQLVEQGMSSPSAMSLVYPVMRGDGQTPGASFVISVNRGLSREDPPKLILTADWLPGESIAFEVTGAGVDLRDLADQVAEFVRTMYGQMLHAFDELRASADRVGLTEAPV